MQPQLPELNNKHILRLLTLLLAALLSVNLSAQTFSEQDESEITTRLVEYFEFTKANDYAQMIEYVYPKVFSLATKEQLLEVFNSLESLGIGLTVDRIELRNVESLHEGTQRYALAKYDTDIRLELKTAQMQSDQVVESLKGSFKAQYNAETVEYDPETKMMTFSGYKYVVAIKDADFDAEEWYFLEYDATNAQASQMLLGQDAFAKLVEKMK